MQILNLKFATNTFQFPEVKYDTGVYLFASGCFSLPQEENTNMLLPACDGYALLYAAVGKFTIASGDKYEELDTSHALLLRTKNDIPCVISAAAAPGEGVFVTFGGLAADKIVNQFPQNAYMQFFIHQESALLCGLLETISDAQNGIIANAHQGGSRVFTLLCELCRRLEPTNVTPGNTIVEQTMILIRERYPYLDSVDELAECLGISKNHLIREFTYHTGTSPWQFLTRTRIESAQSLLKDSNYTIEIIGQLVGYANGNYFCKVFKRQVGITPKEFRRCHYFEHPNTALKNVLDPFIEP